MEISIVLFLLIYLQVMIFKKSIILKLIHKFKLFQTKNKDNLVKADLLLFIRNFIISNLSN